MALNLLFPVTRIQAEDVPKVNVERASVVGGLFSSRGELDAEGGPVLTVVWRELPKGFRDSLKLSVQGNQVRSEVPELGWLINLSGSLTGGGEAEQKGAGLAAFFARLFEPLLETDELLRMDKIERAVSGLADGIGLLSPLQRLFSSKGYISLPDLTLEGEVAGLLATYGLAAVLYAAQKLGVVGQEISAQEERTSEGATTVQLTVNGDVNFVFELAAGDTYRSSRGYIVCQYRREPHFEYPNMLDSQA